MHHFHGLQRGDSPKTSLFLPVPLTRCPLSRVDRWTMSITDVLSAEDIAAALQECQGKGQLRPGRVFPLYSHFRQSPQKLTCELCRKFMGTENKTVID